MPSKVTLGALDIGTNSTHLVIADVDDQGHFRTRDSDKLVVRLGAHLDRRGNLSPKGAQKLLRAVRYALEICKPYGCPIRVVATHALREARNHPELIRRIAEETGVEIEVVDGLEEARLILLGIREGNAVENETILGVDVGGGSTEIAVGNADEILYLNSISLGAVILTRNFLGEAPRPEAIRELGSFIEARLAPLVSDLKRLKFDKAFLTSGTAKALANMHSRLIVDKNVDNFDGYTMSSTDICTMTDRLRLLAHPKKIREYSKLDGGRAEIILAGAMVLEKLAAIFNVDQWMFSSCALREGIIVDTFRRMNGSGSKPNAKSIRKTSVVALAAHYHVDRAYAEHVTNLALQVFHDVAPFLLHVPEQRLKWCGEMLEAAGLLHEVGKTVSFPRYHKHSHYLIANGRMLGYSENERIFVGLLARFHRKKSPEEGNLNVAYLTKEEFSLLRVSSACLRAAVALNRSRQQRVLSISAALGPRGVHMTCEYSGEFPAIELYQLKCEQAAIEGCFGREVFFVGQLHGKGRTEIAVTRK